MKKGEGKKKGKKGRSNDEEKLGRNSRVRTGRL